MRSPKHTLRLRRIVSGLTEAEVAYLLSGDADGRMSRYVHRARGPSLTTAFGFQVLFGAAAHELLPEFFAEVEQAIIQRADLLSKRLAAQQPSAKQRRKLRTLERLMSRGR